ncbi:MAG: homoserine O-acetyltransferase [Deltaproteobacteria bacterium RBG_13_52_11b]|nr:MAG: homoserine O-acetyltransferase [Deltaproteobacteria bacterium RBG_13_52_11b]
MGHVETLYYQFALPPNELTLESGEKLGPITVAYETYGQLNADRSNAILILHALTGDAHAAGFHKGEGKPGWWDDMIGPGKAFDTRKYFVICSNILGGCRGTTGPSSINPKTGKRYGLDFPIITISDMVQVQKHLSDHLRIDRLLSVAGGSMGGMQALEWLTAHPDRLKSAIIIATAAKHSAQQIALNEVGRQAIMADPNWKEGHYYGGHLPAKGLAVARMVGHITYMSETSMGEKFGRRLKDNAKKQKFSIDFEVEDYLHNRGNNFVKRFDANSYLYITKAIDSFDVSRGKPLQQAFKGIKARALVLAFKSDWLYPASQSLEIVKACKLAGIETTYCEIDSTYGHDAFLLEIEEESHLVKHFLQNVSSAPVVTEENEVMAYDI